MKGLYLSSDHVRMKKLHLHWAKVESLTSVVPEYRREFEDSQGYTAKPCLTG